MGGVYKINIFTFFILNIIWTLFSINFGLFGASKIDQKSSSDDVKNKKAKMLIFDTAPLQNQYFWVPMEVKMEAEWVLKSIFIAIENDD